MALILGPVVSEALRPDIDIGGGDDGVFEIEELISTDDGNYLKLGSDYRLLASHEDTDFTAYYTLKRD